MHARTLIASFILLAVSTQVFPQAGSGWTNVQRLPAGQLIRVRFQHHVTICGFNSADDEELICTQKRTVFFVPVRSVIRLRRADVQSVRISRHAASTALGAAIGVGAGAGIGAAIDDSAKNKVEEGHLMAVVMGLLGGPIGAGIGSHNDFLSGPLIYQAH